MKKLIKQLFCKHDKVLELTSGGGYVTCTKCDRCFGIYHYRDRKHLQDVYKQMYPLQDFP